MHVSLWTYPWDLQDVGVAAGLDEILNRAGADGVSLAVSYHAGRFLQARSPQRKTYFPEDGTIYFEPTLARYGRIQPKVAEIVRERGDVFRQLADARERRPFRLNAWTVCLHNTRLGMAYPDVTARSAFGDPAYYSLCPSHPDARQYVTAMVADLTERYRPDSVELETPTHMGFGHGYHHEKDEVGLSAYEQFLLGLCFCDHCMARAKAAGVDAEAARRHVRQVITEACERPVPVEQPVPATPDSFPPAISDYLRWRSEPVTSLVEEIRAAAHPESQVYILSGAPARAWQSGLDLPAVAKILDGIVVLGYDQDPAGVAATTTAARQIKNSGYLSVGLRLACPIQSAGDLKARMAAARQAGAEGVNLYNYGLVPPSRLDWVRFAAQQNEEV